jgi:hypothetical protein
MSHRNYFGREINFNVVYEGPPGAGKITSMMGIYNRTRPSEKGKIWDKQGAGVLSQHFDTLLPESYVVDGLRVRLHLSAQPDQSVLYAQHAYYEGERLALQARADGIVFVADGRIERMKDNVKRLSEIRNTRRWNDKTAPFAFVVQCNKRDLPNVASVDDIRDALGVDAPYVESIATTGQGLFPALKLLVKELLDKDASS